MEKEFKVPKVTVNIIQSAKIGTQAGQMCREAYSLCSKSMPSKPAWHGLPLVYTLSLVDEGSGNPTNQLQAKMPVKIAAMRGDQPCGNPWPVVRSVEKPHALTCDWSSLNHDATESTIPRTVSVST